MPKININGITREMTAQEVAEMEAMAAEMPLPEPTEQDRLRADVDFLLMLMEG